MTGELVMLALRLAAIVSTPTTIGLAMVASISVCGGNQSLGEDSQRASTPIF